MNEASRQLNEAIGKSIADAMRERGITTTTERLWQAAHRLADNPGEREALDESIAAAHEDREPIPDRAPAVDP